VASLGDTDPGSNAGAALEQAQTLGEDFDFGLSLADA